MDIKTLTTRFIGTKKAAFLLAVFIIFCAPQSILAENGHWVTTWGSAQYATVSGNLPPASLEHSTLRQFVRVSIPGKLVRIQLSNAYGASSVTINAAHIALAAGGGSAIGEIDPATDTPLRFRGAPSTVIPPGGVIYSDPVAFDLSARADVAISLYFGDASSTSVSGHAGSRTTSYIKAGNVVSDATLLPASTTVRWYIISNIEVMADPSSQSVVVLGDSITDGYGTTTDGNTRWTDFLAERLIANGPTANVGMINMGIGGNAIFGGEGPAGTIRFEGDVLNQTGVRWLIIFEGVNDIGGASDSYAPTLAQNMIATMEDFANQAHAKNILVYGATITPIAGSFYDTSARRTARQTVNTWIRTNTVYDAVIDLDAAIRDPSNPEYLLPAYDGGDHLHPSNAGYEAMGDAVDLNLFVNP